MDDISATCPVIRNRLQLLGPVAAFMLSITLLFSGVTKPASAEAQPLRVAVSALPSASFNPWASPNIPGVYVLAAVFDGLTRTGRDGEVRPWLAVTWENTDPLEWRFTLRDDVQFSNGRPLDASAVVAAITYLTGVDTVREILAQDLAHIESAEAADDHSVLIRLKRPDVLLPNVLSHLGVPEPTVFEQKGPDAFARNPIGTGPFQVTSLTSTQVRFEANPHAWNRPKAPSLQMMVLPEAAARVSSLLSGATEIAFAIGPDNGASIQDIGASVYTARLPAVLGLILVSTREASPLSDPRVRQALNYAVNTDRLVETVLGSASRPSNQPAAPGVFGHNSDVEPFGYDPTRARALLTEAGFAEGFEMRAELSLSGSAHEALVYQQVAADLARVGVTLTLQSIPYANFAGKFRSGAWDGDAFNLMFSAEPSLDGLRAIRYHSCIWPGNWFCDPATTPLIDEAVRATSLAQRQDLTRQVMARYRDLAPAIFLYQQPQYFGLSPDIQGFELINSFIPWHRIQLDQ